MLKCPARSWLLGVFGTVSLGIALGLAGCTTLDVQKDRTSQAEGKDGKKKEQRERPDKDTYLEDYEIVDPAKGRSDSYYDRSREAEPPPSGE